MSPQGRGTGRGRGGNALASRGRGSGGHHSNGGKGRYSADVTKGPSAWKSEWSGFISGVKMTDQGRRVKLPSVMDHQREAGGDDDDGEGNLNTYSYLFSSPADRKAEREAKKKELEAKKRERELANKRAGLAEYEGDDRSKMERALENAKVQGVKLEGLNRKQRRELLHLTSSGDVADANDDNVADEEKEIKPHDLMENHIAWYQQGPYPIDEIAERLVIKKAAKKAKQVGLKYNSLTVHPSWVASRANKRKMLLTVPSGSRKVFDSNGYAMDAENTNKWPISAAVVLAFGGAAASSALAHTAVGGGSIGFEGSAPVLPDATPGLLLLQKYQEQQQRKRLERIAAKQHQSNTGSDDDADSDDGIPSAHHPVDEKKKPQKVASHKVHGPAASKGKDDERKAPRASAAVATDNKHDDAPQVKSSEVDEGTLEESDEEVSGEENESVAEEAEVENDDANDDMSEDESATSSKAKSAERAKKSQVANNKKASRKEEKVSNKKKLNKKNQKAGTDVPKKKPTRDPKPNSNRTLKQLNYDKYGGKRPPRSVREELKKKKLEAQQKREAQRLKAARKAETASQTVAKDPNAPSNKQLKKQQRLEAFLAKKKAAEQGDE